MAVNAAVALAEFCVAFQAKPEMTAAPTATATLETEPIALNVSGSTATTLDQIRVRRCSRRRALARARWRRTADEARSSANLGRPVPAHPLVACCADLPHLSSDRSRQRGSDGQEVA